MVSQGSGADSDGLPVFFQVSPCSSPLEEGFSSPELNAGEGFGVYANTAVVLEVEAVSHPIVGEIPRERTGVEPSTSPLVSKVPRDKRVRELLDRELDRMEIEEARKTISVLRSFIKTKGYNFEDFLVSPSTGDEEALIPDPFQNKLKGKIDSPPSLFVERPEPKNLVVNSASPNFTGSLNTEFAGPGNVNES